MIWGKERQPVVATPVNCPACHSIEHMTVRPAYRAEIVNGRVIQHECGVCVVCLRCDTPYVIVGHEAGGIIKRRRVAAGHEIPMPRPEVDTRNRRPDANGIIDSLGKSLGEGRMMEEPD